MGSEQRLEGSGGERRGGRVGSFILARILTIVFLFLSLFLFLIENKKSAFALLQQHHQGTSRSLSRHRLSQIQA